jgi:hypothetical protein
MPNYSCEKCGNYFYQKSDYDKHMDLKIPCDETNMSESVADLKKTLEKLEIIIPEIEYFKNEKLEDIITPEVKSVSPEKMSTTEHKDDKPIMEIWESKKHNMNVASLKKVATIIECKFPSKIKKNDIITKISETLSEKNEENSKWLTVELKQKLITLLNIKSGTRTHANKINADVKIPKKNNPNKLTNSTIVEEKSTVTPGIKEKSTNPIHRLVDVMHNIMRDSESISGKKAYNDMIKLLCLRFIKPYLNGGLKFLTEHNYDNNGESLNQYKHLLSFDNLHNEVKSKGDEVLEDTLYKIYDMLSQHNNFECIFKKKKTFNCSKGITLRKCIEAINIELNGYDFKNSKSDIIGEIHEYFVNNYY